MNNENPRIVVGLVTFNRCELLTRCIDNLLKQTRAVDHIVIVDNASTDQTIERITKYGLQTPVSKEKRFEVDFVNSCPLHPSGTVGFTYVRLSYNTGGAGGFNEAQKIAIQKGCDYMWLMDDDGFPSEKCLETLLFDDLGDLKVRNPVVINCEDHERLSFGLGKGVRTVEAANAIANSNGKIDGIANPFNGTLISRHVVEKVGFIKKEMFIWGDETEYTLRLRKHSIGIETDVKSLFYHPHTKSETMSSRFGLVKIDKKPSILEMNYYRNRGYIDRKYFLGLPTPIIIRAIMFYFIQFDLSKLKTIISYYLDGYLDKFKLENLRK